MKKTSFLFLFLFSFSPSAFYSQAPGWLWAKSAGGVKSEKAYAVHTDLSGNIYAGGYFFSDSITFGTKTFYSMGAAAFLVKYDPSGNVIWAKASQHTGTIYGITSDKAGNIYIAGGFLGYIIFDGHYLSNSFPNSSTFDIFLVKYDSSGNFLWAKNPKGTSDADDVAQSVAVDSTGNVYIGGYFGSKVLVFDTDTLHDTNPSSFQPSSDMFVAKYNSSGNALWVRNGICGDDDMAYGVSTDGFGNVYSVGVFNTTQIVFGRDTLINTGSTDLFIVKFDSLGKEKWAHTTGGSPGTQSYAYSVTTDANNSIFIAGEFGSFPILTLGTYTLSSATGFILIAKYDTSGNILWAKNAGSNSNKGESAYSVCADMLGNVYLTGSFQSPSITFGSCTVNNNSVPDSIDVFVLKYDGAGNPLWIQSAGGIGYDRANAISVDPNGIVYIAGCYTSTSISFGPSTFSNTAYNYMDVFIAKLDNIADVREILNTNNLTIYPNPSSGIINFETTEMPKAVTIYNSLGELVYEIKKPLMTEQIDISGQRPGVYFCKIKLQSGERVFKIIKTD
ncbi:MAG TPA: T9SS type A sorting domain-containing protein [Bacteroidia bacterium]|nr:T9SS type A sorting domain-containing protein [Bacteroidia bacterium]